MLAFLLQGPLLNLVLLRDLEHLLVAAKGHRAQLIIIPLLVGYGLNVAVLHASRRHHMLMSTLLADHDTQENRHVSSLVLQASYAELVERILKKLLEVLLNLW